MNKSTIKMSIVYGLYLGWILSFLYSGALFEIVFSSSAFNMDILLLLTHTLPIFIIFLFRRKWLRKEYHRNILYITVLVSAGISLFFAFFAKGIKNEIVFVIFILLATVTGIAELMFIVVATGWFIKYIPVKKMFVAMALVIVVGNIVVEICQTLIYFNYEEFAMLGSIFACVGAFFLARSLPEEDEITRTIYEIALPKHTIPLLSVAFFLFSIGGGVVFEVVTPMLESFFHYAVLFDLLPYIFAGVITFFLLIKTDPNINLFLTIAAGFIILGLIIFQFLGTKWGLFTSEMLIVSGYSILDIFMWGLVGMISYVYYEPSKVVYYTMSFNVLGVVFGSVISILLTLNTGEEGITASLISLLCAVIGMIIIPIIYKEAVLEAEKELFVLKKEASKKKDLIESSEYDLLSNREKEVVELLISNFKNKEIAEQLFISENTLKKHARSIYSKLNVQNKKELKELFVVQTK